MDIEKLLEILTNAKCMVGLVRWGFYHQLVAEGTVHTDVKGLRVKEERFTFADIAKIEVCEGGPFIILRS